MVLALSMALTAMPLPALAQQHSGNHNYHNGGSAKNGQQLLIFCTLLKSSLYVDYILQLC